MFSINKRIGNFIRLIPISILAICLFFNFAMNRFFITAKSKNISCEAFFTVDNGYLTIGVMGFHINGINNGRINLSATIKDRDGIKYDLLRSISFDYRYEGDGYISLNKTQIIKSAGDNTPDILFSQSIFDFSVKERKLRITQVGDSYLLWNNFSPVMLCTPINR
ncbi:MULTISPECIES: hypothetical protein [Klebsiella pneumoniae complex]|uniref:hypothetical protein n=1 Tax=Klebsiella pneumoniae complex TaxID=3390273 RepID=UPI0027302145|nr:MULTISPECIES: hypothetical protein [Klebsiella]MDP1292914.1 hypothetical protein [Klebsiella variicola]MDP1339890.1 hypothetical protein [Klebsiella variicola]